MEKNNYDTIVLSGASSKGLMMLGALQYAYDNGILSQIKTFVGVSAGAITSLLLIIGYSPVEILTCICTSRMMEKMKNMDLHSMLNGKGAISYSLLETEYEKMIRNKLGFIPTIGQIKEIFGKDLICGTYNFTKRRIELATNQDFPGLYEKTSKYILNIKDESCLVPLRMSANLPFVFEHFLYNGDLYMDGGIADNFPIDVADCLGENILGITIAPEEKEPTHFLEFMYEIAFIPNYVYIKEKIDRVDKNKKCTVINLVSGVKFYDFSMKASDKLDMFSEGYKVMEAEFR